MNFYELYKLVEGYQILPGIDKEEYPEKPGLEGPIRLRSGKVVYYDKRLGKYYDSKTDMYLSDEEYMSHDKSTAPYHNSPLTDPSSREYEYMKRKGF